MILNVKVNIYIYIFFFAREGLQCMLLVKHCSGRKTEGTWIVRNSKCMRRLERRICREERTVGS